MSKKETKTKDSLKSLSLKSLFEDKVLFSKVVNLMNKRETYAYIQSFLKTKGYKISTASLTNLKKKIIESNETGVPLEKLVDKRTKNSINDVKPENLSGYTPNGISKSEAYATYDNSDGVVPVDIAPQKVYSIRQVLEEGIAKGYATLQQLDVIDTSTWLKMIDLYLKNFDASDGLTTDALASYQIIVDAQLNAMNEVLEKYLPEDKREEAKKEMQVLTDECLKEFQLTNDGKALVKALKDAGIAI